MVNLLCCLIAIILVNGLNKIDICGILSKILDFQNAESVDNGFRLENSERLSERSHRYEKVTFQQNISKIDWNLWNFNNFSFGTIVLYLGSLHSQQHLTNLKKIRIFFFLYNGFVYLNWFQALLFLLLAIQSLKMANLLSIKGPFEDNGQPF